ncbi:ATP-dependent DNA helicase RecG [Verrucomicrobiaceae bacterium 5K15]|uniref:ATP-dependent DNA helicase RecG n=1 Tax=Oceaniferula flava TaxID=2800421 RepID=A0AAE2V9S3_9BACT|nr:ATP-dependent DNA helicase RecG [Oceaniferula flavus]MBK1855643.1 ATP-dependent DNA helicase RecG [Oceaniferula flavus]MBM1136949.1 ATP-dependent DNA helicase RecG [Oceaniferula flavus]
MNGHRCEEPLSSVDFIVAKDVLAYGSAGVNTTGELLDRLPKRYEDRRVFDSFPAQAGGTALCLRGTVVDTQVKRFGGRKQFYQAVVFEGGSNALNSNKITCRWFNMPWMKNALAEGHEVILYGKPKEYQGGMVIDHPDFEIVGDSDEVSIHLERIVPIYKGVSGIPQRRLREHIYKLLETTDVSSLKPIYDVDPSYPRHEALREAHFPDSLEQAEAAKRYFALEEFFALQLSVVWKRARVREHQGRVLGKKTKLLTEFYHSLPFDLTGAQKRSVKEVLADMRAPYPMSRLLQGDVGSGKTFVAMCAMLLAVESGVQAALMAPTQILAEQHYLTFKKWLAPLNLRISLRTGSRQENAHMEMEGEPQIIIGTHALLYEGVEFADLGLIVIDEQHKFGVGQRSSLIQQGVMPDVLVMTATPIPRTLTLTIYGDLDVSILDERPAGRGEIITAVRAKPKVTDITKFIKEQLVKERQVYLVYPLVEESDALKAAAATVEYEKWVKRLSKFKVGLLHGKLKPEEKDEVMTRFRDRELDVLVATTVIEVGVDVPNANTMIIYNAERFGLAQLHQLRGRIGRGEHKSYCVLATDGKSADAMEKLQVMADTSDGFKIAEADLRLRGPGDVLGTEQSGLANLKFIDYLADTALIREARELAETVLAQDPMLEKNPALLRLIHDGEVEVG